MNNHEWCGVCQDVTAPTPDGDVWVCEVCHHGPRRAPQRTPQQ